jgi:hypothetical protein
LRGNELLNIKFKDVLVYEDHIEVKFIRSKARKQVVVDDFWITDSKMMSLMKEYIALYQSEHFANVLQMKEKVIIYTKIYNY